MSSASSAIITPIMIYMFSVRPPAHRGPRMVASPPTERRTPWLNPAMTWELNRPNVTGCKAYSKLTCLKYESLTAHWPGQAELGGAISRLLDSFLLTLCSLSSNFGEQGNLSHSYKWQTQDLQKHPNDELSQLPRETTWRKQKSRMSNHDTAMVSIVRMPFPFVCLSQA